MIIFASHRPPLRGSSLIETMIAMAVLAIAIPLVFGILAESSRSQFSAAAETRSTWMVPACMAEIHASREGDPQFFTPTQTAQIFPPPGDIWALAFSPAGKPIGKISKATYQLGTRQLMGQPIRYLATLSTTTHSTKPLLPTRITLEYPASAPLAKRQKLDFYTQIP